MAEIIDTADLPWTYGTGYPEPFRAAVAGRGARRIGDLLGMTQFGVNLVRLAPGAWSSQRHWHLVEDELLLMLEGEADAVFLVVGSKRGAEEAVDYPDIDLMIPAGTGAYHHKDGSPYG